MENYKKIMKLVMRCYLLKDKWLLLSAASLIYQPKNLILYIKEYVDGEFVEKTEWPISETKYISKIEEIKDEIATWDKEFYKKLKQT